MSANRVAVALADLLEVFQESAARGLSLEDLKRVRVEEFLSATESAETRDVERAMAQGLGAAAVVSHRPREGTAAASAFGQTQRVWSDYLDAPQSRRLIQSDWWFQPKSLDDLERAVRRAIDAGKRLKPHGARHSSSSVARPENGHATVDLRELKLTPSAMDGVELVGPSLVRIAAGLDVAAVNQALHGRGLALPNAGSEDVQSITGAICTGTHGSNRHLGPMANFVRALEMICVVDTGAGFAPRRVQVQPIGLGLKVQTDGASLIEDDELFYCAVCSMGCFGIVYGIVLEVEPAFWMSEVRTRTTWSAVRPTFGKLFDEDFVDLIVNANRFDGENTVIVTRRQRASPGQRVIRPDIPVPSLLVQRLAAENPSIAAHFIEHELRTKYNTTSLAPSFEIFHIGGAGIMAQSIEIGVPLDRARDAVDAVIEQADRRGYLHTSPFGVRFVGPSPHVLSFAAGTAPICAIEIPLLTWQDDCDTILEELELLLCSTLFRGRPHWGQMHHMDGARARAKYGAGWDRWVHYYRRWNASGMFSNAFTEQLNLDLWWQGGSTT